VVTRVLQVNGSTDLTIRDSEIDAAMTSAANTTVSLLDICNTAATTCNAVIDNCIWKNTNTAGRGIVLADHSWLTTERIVIRDCDFTGVVGSAIVVVDPGVGVVDARTRAINCLYAATPAAAVITKGGSPFIYTNEDFYDEDVIVSGATVTKIELCTDGSNFTDTVLTAGIFHLRAGDKLKVTYSDTPVMTKVPKP
jgi:hypothetical protein